MPSAGPGLWAPSVFLPDTSSQAQGGPAGGSPETMLPCRHNSAPGAVSWGRPARCLFLGWETWGQTRGQPLECNLES